MPRPLKVFRTAVGFRDAYVAVPSKAAALRAWGTRKDLFARGAAEEVTDPALTGEALRKPGEVVYRTRGGLDEQVAALGPLPHRKAGLAKDVDHAPPAESARRKTPRPSRTRLDTAERALEALRQERDRADAELHEREQALAAQRQALKERFAKDLKRVERTARQARLDYEAKLRQWEP